MIQRVRTIPVDTQSLLYERGLEMKWETPKATDLRFGMEITMYVANR